MLSHNILCCRVESDSFASKSGHRIYLRRSPRWDEDGNECDTNKEQGDQREGRWILRSKARQF